MLTCRRTIENVIEKLLSWGSESVYHVSNQPALPHAVIVLNKCANDEPSETWDRKHTTKWLLSVLDDDLYNNPRFAKYLSAWKRFKTKRQ